MPPKKNYSRRRPYAKRTRKAGRRSSKYGRRGRIARVPRGIASTPFPSQMYKVLTYTDDTFLLSTPAIDTCGYAEYRGNSLFDPDLTGVGNQPRFFDTLCGAQGTAAPYRSFNVIASKIIVDIFQNPSLAAGGQACTVFVVPNRGTSAGDNLPDDMTAAIETPYVRKKDIGVNASWKPRRITSYMKSKAIFNDTSGSDNNFFGGYASNPINGWKWSVGVCNIIPGNNTSVYCRVTIKYYTMFNLLNEVARS